MHVRLDIAREVAAARAAVPPVAWKLLQRRFRLSRSVLAEAGRWGARLLAAANDVRPVAAANMSGGHLAGCNPAAGALSLDPTRRDAEATGMQQLFGGVKTPAVQQAAPAPAKEDPAVLEARQKALVNQRIARGRDSTRLTAPTGVAGQGSNTLRTTLGGA